MAFHPHALGIAAMMRIIGCFGAIGLCLAFACAARAESRPNLIVMMCDDQRADALSCRGNAVLQTPHLDRLAKEGITFENMFVTNSLCAPSRATLLTGKYAHIHGVRDNMGRKLPAEQKLVSDYLREAGYAVAFCGKSHINGALRDRRWDYYFGYKGQGDYHNPSIAESDAAGKIGPDRRYTGYMDDIVTEHAIAWLKRPRHQPFCLFLFFKAPHRRWLRAPRYEKLYADVTIPKNPLWDDLGLGKPSAFLMAANMIGQFPDAKDYQQMLKDYYATIAAVDDNVGKVLAALSDLKILDDTVVMHTSDNGFFLGEWQRFDKRFMHEPSIRVPLLVRYPKLIRAGSTTSLMSLNLDLAPTLMELAGIAVPKDMQGRSLKPLLAGQSPPWRHDWYYAYHEYPDPSHNVRKNRGLRTDRYKLIHYHEKPEEWELYDLKEDPLERVNLVGQPGHAALLAELRSRLAALRAEVGEVD
jgi:arylsulfatase A-like enzyme